MHAESREHLKTLLDGRQANGIIFTSMQKFEESEEPLSERRNIVVMADAVQTVMTQCELWTDNTDMRDNVVNFHKPVTYSSEPQATMKVAEEPVPYGNK